MKFSSIRTGLLAITFAACSMATVNLTTPESPVHVGDNVDLEWSSDKDYYFELLLVKKGEAPIAWEPAKSYFKDRKTPRGEGTFSVEVPNVDPQGDYAFWLSGEDVVGNGGYANLTDWFKIEGDLGKACG